MASTMASTLDLSRPSEKFGTHSTSVLGIREKDKGMGRVPQLRRSEIFPRQQTRAYVPCFLRKWRCGMSRLHERTYRQERRHQGEVLKSVVRPLSRGASTREAVLMPRYVIEREIPNAGKLSPQELKG